MHKHEKKHEESFEIRFDLRNNNTLQAADRPIFLSPAEGPLFKDLDSVREYIAASSLFTRAGSKEVVHICELGPEIKSGVNVLAFKTEAGNLLLDVSYHKIHPISLGQLLNGDDTDYSGEVKERRNLDGGVIRNVH